MTTGEIYNKNKATYDKYAIEYINTFLSEVGNKAHRPHEMMTHWQRTICERIDTDNFLVYEGFVNDTEYSDGREIKDYSGEKVNPKVHNLDTLIEGFGFQISLNPNSYANKEINNLKQ